MQDDVAPDANQGLQQPSDRAHDAADRGLLSLLALALRQLSDLITAELALARQAALCSLRRVLLAAAMLLASVLAVFAALVQVAATVAAIGVAVGLPAWLASLLATIVLLGLAMAFLAFARWLLRHSLDPVAEVKRHLQQDITGLAQAVVGKESSDDTSNSQNRV